MAMKNETNPSMWAVILAGGKDAIDANGRSMLLSRLGDSSILECVVRTGLEFVPAGRLLIVVGYRQHSLGN
jgi:hypothetical protein